MRKQDTSEEPKCEKIECEIRNGYLFEAKNKDTYRGCYYGEDDWSMEVYADSLESLIENTAKEVISTGIEVVYVSVSKVKRLSCNYEGKTFHFTLAKTELEGLDFYQKVKSSETYKRLCLEKEAREEKLRELQEERAKRNTIRREKKLLTYLANKYGMEEKDLM